MPQRPVETRLIAQREGEAPLFVVQAIDRLAAFRFELGAQRFDLVLYRLIAIYLGAVNRKTVGQGAETEQCGTDDEFKAVEP